MTAADLRRLALAALRAPRESAVPLVVLAAVAGLALVALDRHVAAAGPRPLVVAVGGSVAGSPFAVGAAAVADDRSAVADDPALAAADRAADAGRPDEALGHLRDLVARHPTNLFARTRLGLMARRAGRDDEAEAAWSATLAQDSGAVAAAVNLGVLRAQRGDAAGAEALYRAVLRRVPVHGRATFNLGLALRDQGRAAEAEAAFGLAADRTSGPLRAKALHHRARVRLVQGDTTGAVADLREATSLAPADLGPRTTLAGFDPAARDALDRLSTP